MTSHEKRSLNITCFASFGKTEVVFDPCLIDWRETVDDVALKQLLDRVDPKSKEGVELIEYVLDDEYYEYVWEVREIALSKLDCCYYAHREMLIKVLKTGLLTKELLSRVLNVDSFYKPQDLIDPLVEGFECGIFIRYINSRRRVYWKLYNQCCEMLDFEKTWHWILAKKLWKLKQCKETLYKKFKGYEEYFTEELYEMAVNPRTCSVDVLKSLEVCQRTHHKAISAILDHEEVNLFDGAIIDYIAEYIDSVGAYQIISRAALNVKLSPEQRAVFIRKLPKGYMTYTLKKILNKDQYHECRIAAIERINQSQAKMDIMNYFDSVDDNVKLRLLDILDPMVFETLIFTAIIYSKNNLILRKAAMKRWDAHKNADLIAWMYRKEMYPELKWELIDKMFEAGEEEFLSS